MEQLNDYILSITPSNKDFSEQALDHWDHLTHPIGSLGLLEEMTIKLAEIQEKKIPTINKKAIIVMCSDNGIFDEDISSSPQVFTQLLANSMANGMTGVCALADYAGAEVEVVDIGMLNTMDRDEKICLKPINRGTKNFYKEPAMTREEVIAGLKVGIEVAERKINEGCDILGTGELGIANTTTASAVFYGLTDLTIEECVGLGAGISDTQFAKKKKVIEESVERYGLKSGKRDVIDVLAKVGSLDIVGLTGVFLAGAKNKVPVVLDGFISSVAALCAVMINENVRDYICASHLSKEVASRKILEILGLKPLVTLEMRLGEGSGCPFTFLILESGINCMNKMGNFEETDINASVQVNIRDQVNE